MRSDTYTIIFTMIVTVILGLGLSVTADSLRDRQQLNEELDIKKNILSVLGFDKNKEWSNDEVQSLYDKNIREIIINSFGEKLDGTIPTDNSVYCWVLRKSLVSGKPSVAHREYIRNCALNARTTLILCTPILSALIYVLGAINQDIRNSVFGLKCLFFYFYNYKKKYLFLFPLVLY